MNFKIKIKPYLINEIADALAKEARPLNTNRITKVTLSDISSVAKAKLIDRETNIKHQIPEISTNRTLTSTLTRLRTGHFRGMKVHKYGTRTFFHRKNCPDTELTPEHLFNCSAILAKLQQISDNPWADLYKENCLRIADAVHRTFDPI